MIFFHSSDFSAEPVHTKYQPMVLSNLPKYLHSKNLPIKLNPPALDLVAGTTDPHFNDIVIDGIFVIVTVIDLLFTHWPAATKQLSYSLFTVILLLVFVKYVMVKIQ